MQVFVQIISCLYVCTMSTRKQRAEMLVKLINSSDEKYYCKQKGTNLYSMSSQTSPVTKAYDVSLKSCTCLDRQYRQTTCKHMIALQIILQTPKVTSPKSVETAPAVLLLWRDNLTQAKKGTELPSLLAWRCFDAENVYQGKKA